MDDFLVPVKDPKSGQIKYQSNQDTEQKKVNKELARLRASYMFRNKMQKLEKESIFHKLNLLVKLRLLEGPLFIHALQEMINLMK